MDQLFQNIKYYVVGNLKDEDIIDDLLESRGAKKYSYLTGQVSLVIAETPGINEEDPPEIEEARDIHETSCVSPDWVRLSVTCDQLLPQELFYPKRKLFTDKIFIVDLEKSPQYDMSDIDVLWTLILTNGGHILNLKVFTNPEIENITKYMEEIKEKDFYVITDTNFETIENWIETLSEGTKLNEFFQLTTNLTFITPDWITDSIELSTLVADTLKYHPKYLNSFSTCLTPDVDAILTVSSAAPITMATSLPTEPMETNSDKITADNITLKYPFQLTTIINLALYGHWNIDYVPSTSLENTCVDEKLAPSNLCLLGCIFYIDDYAETIPAHLLKSWKKVITLHGGKILLEIDITGNDDIDLNNSKITHFLTSSQTELWQKAHKAGKRCITAHWLNDVISRCNTNNSKTSTIASDLNAKNENVKSDDSETRKKISLNKIPEILAEPPWKILHFPMPTLPSNITHFMQSQIISITQFDGEEREQLKLMIWRAGAKYSGTLNRNVTTILIAKSNNAGIDIESEKIEKALEWNIPIITSQWLIDCLTLQMFQANISPSEELEPENVEIKILNKTLSLNNNNHNENQENSDINIKYKAVKMVSQTPFFLREKTVKNDSKVELSSKFPYTYMYDIEQNSNAEFLPDINGLGSENPKTIYKPLFLEYWNEVPKLLEPWKKPLTLSNSTIQEAIKMHDTLSKTNGSKQLSSEKRNGGKKRSFDQITTEPDHKNGHNLSGLESKFSNNVTQQTPEIVDLSTAPDINSQATWEMANKKRLIQVAAMLSKRISLSSNTIIPLNNSNSANNVEIFDHSSPKNTLSANIGGKLNGCCKISSNKYIRIMFTGQTKSKLMDLQKKTQELITRLNNQLINTGQSPHHHHASPLKSPIELSSYESNISSHNIEITENPMLATHLILERPLRRTLKLLFVLGAGTSHSKYPLTPDWIVESARMAKILDESDYLFHDECAEQEFDFCLKTALYRSQHRGPLFKNISFYITPNVDPNVKLLKHIIEVSGGVFVKQRPSIRQINMQNKDKSKFLIISCPKDVPSCKDYTSQDINLYHVELILTSLMRQTINYEQFILDPEGES